MIGCQHFGLAIAGSGEKGKWRITKDWAYFIWVGRTSWQKESRVKDWSYMIPKTWLPMQSALA